VSFPDHVDALIAEQGMTGEERALLDAELSSFERTGAGVAVNEVWRLELGAAREGAYFKPINGLNQSVAYHFGHTRESAFLSEVSAYRLACALGEPFAALVPPCVVRSFPEIDAHAPGALASERFDDRRDEVFFRAPDLVLRGAFFDALIANQDRSRTNMLFDTGRNDLALIDHGFAFAREGDVINASVLLGWRRTAGLVELSQAEVDALERLVYHEALLGLRRYLEPDRAEALEVRARRMLETGRLV
jgi:hypothetical protein